MKPTPNRHETTWKRHGNDIGLLIGVGAGIPASRTARIAVCLSVAEKNRWVWDAGGGLFT